MSNEPKHTAIPWTDDKFTPIPAGDDRVLLGAFRQKPKVAVRVLSEENFQRAKQCVEACEGMNDPEYVLRIMKGIKVNTDGSPYLDDVITELESLRAERAELIEALRLGRKELMRAEMSLIECGYGTGSSTIQSIENAIQTLAKYEKP